MNNDVWLSRQQIATLFDRDIKTIGKHINNALKEELAEFSLVANIATSESIDINNSVVAKFATTAADGIVYQMEHYNLDMILSVERGSINGQIRVDKCAKPRCYDYRE